MTDVDPRVLHKTREETRDALADLCDEQKRSYMREKIDPDTGAVIGIDGVTRHTSPSLLGQLAQAVAKGTLRGVRGGGGSPLPISADAHDLLTTIGRRTIWLLGETGAQPAGSDIEPNLRAVVGWVCVSSDLETTLGVRNFLRAWVAAIRNLLDPPKRISLWDHACPVETCGQREVWRLDESDGEEKRTAALEVAYAELDSGEWTIRDVHCLACTAEWLPSQLMWLGRLLGCEIEGVQPEGEPAA